MLRRYGFNFANLFLILMSLNQSAHAYYAYANCQTWEDAKHYREATSHYTCCKTYKYYVVPNWVWSNSENTCLRKGGTVSSDCDERVEIDGSSQELNQHCASVTLAVKTEHQGGPHA